MADDTAPAPTGHPSAAVLIPIKAFSQAKVRLAGVLNAQERRCLAQRMAIEVIRAARPLPVHVVCDDDEVAEWARTKGAEVIWTPGLGLNGAVEHGVAILAGEGVSRIIVSHADLPLAADLASLLDNPTTTAGHPARAVVRLVPDRRRDGTNVAVVPADCGFRFAYGRGSFPAHCAEATRLGLEFEVAEPAPLTLDIDLPSDLALLPPTWRTNKSC